VGFDAGFDVEFALVDELVMVLDVLDGFAAVVGVNVSHLRL
jgi:hypothetical protein